MDRENENEEGQSKKITLVIKDQDDSTFEFKVKKNITFAKILKTFADKVNKDPSELRLVANGKVLALDKTPDLYNLEDRDEINVVASQEGGSCFY